MNQPWFSRQKKNWQWRIIIWSSLFLLFGKSLGQAIYYRLGIHEVYQTTANIAKKTALTGAFTGIDEASATTLPTLVIDVQSDTASDYTIETKIFSGQALFEGQTLSMGDKKRFLMKPQTPNKKMGVGDIIFLSAPMSGSNNTTCQEIHTLNFDLKYANQIKQPLKVNLSAIASVLDCRNNAVK